MVQPPKHITLEEHLGQIDLSYEDNDTIEQFGVEFQVQYWESNTTS